MLNHVLPRMACSCAIFAIALAHCGCQSLKAPAGWSSASKPPANPNNKEVVTYWGQKKPKAKTPDVDELKNRMASVQDGNRATTFEGHLRQGNQALGANRLEDAQREYEKALAMLDSPKLREAFNLSSESDAVRDSYGRTTYGQSCLLARRLVEAEAKFVTVYFSPNIGGNVGSGWDTHGNNGTKMFPVLEQYHLPITDQTLPTLLEELDQRGLLDTTLVVWMGEFGRTPRCAGGGRNHWAKAWSTVLVGGGIKGGQAVGRTDRDAAAVAERPISVTDFLGTVCTILGIDYTRKNHPPGVNRPIPIVDTSKEVKVLTELR